MMANKIFISCILFMNAFYSIHSQTGKNCEDKMTCDNCIGTEGCSWCKIKDAGTFQRCNTVEGHRSQNAKCSGQDIVTAGSPSQNITRNNPITKTMRIRPQKVAAILPVKKELTVDLTYQDGTDKALDLYYIMDLSATMENDKVTVSDQAANLVRELKTITKDVKLGFGAFVDKPVLPFVSSSHLREDKDNKYDIPYGFKNRLSLSDDTNQFRAAVNEAKISRNLDEPEGTLDALMQAILCKNEIGWRNTSRKLIVVATDGPFHIAGDGKLGGIVIPNDMQCHMKNNEYTHSKLLDYPSIGEINAVILQEKVFVIFAVSTEESNDEFIVYQELAKHISQSTAVLLESDSANVVKEIKAKYLEISQRVQLFVEDKPTFVDVKIKAQCSASSGFIEQDFCTKVGVNSAIKFKIMLTLNECPKLQSPNAKNQVVISFFELTKQEKLVIDLSYACSCSCNNEKYKDANELTKYCNGANASMSISCGICNCKEGRSGQACQCYVSESGETEQGNNDKCINPGGPRGILCSNRGQCKCGQCECDKGNNNVVGWNGKYCEDSTSRCQKKNSQDLCSGNGRCEKGKCICNPGYDGEFCECQISKKELCIEPGQSSKAPLCNDQGTCVCGIQEAHCTCKPGYDGIYCGACKIDCPAGKDKLASRCRDEFLTSCIRCRIKNSRKRDKSTKQQPQQSQSQCNEFCDWGKVKPPSRKDIRAEVSEVRFTEESRRAGLLEIDGAECRIKVDECSSVFKYFYMRSFGGKSDILEVYFTADGLNCPKEPPILWYVFGTILGILLIGIFGLLIWKLATYLHDTREYQRFEKERSGAKFQGGENPLYSKPVSETQNPTYRG